MTVEVLYGFRIIGYHHSESLEPGRIVILLRRSEEYLVEDIEERDLPEMIDKGVVVEQDIVNEWSAVYISQEDVK